MAFETDRSSLRILELSPEWVERLPSLAREVDPLLLHHPEIVIYGRVAHQHRSIGFFSDTSVGYRYSGQLARSLPLTDSLRSLMTYINQTFSAEFNGILVNKYDGGEDYIGKHSDDESALDPSAGVVVVSVGAVRTFRIRGKADNRIVADVPTRPDQILQMAGAFQHEFTHEIPVQKRVDGVRYSFTFRHHTE